MAHNCKNILFHCMDFRLTERIREWMGKEKLLGDCDVVAVAGSAKDLVDGSPGEKEMLLKQIGISAKLHQAKNVILMNHTQCGAYAQSYRFVNEDEEIKRHELDLAKAEKIINNRFADLTVFKLIVIMKDPGGKVVEFMKL